MFGFAITFIINSALSLLLGLFFIMLLNYYLNRNVPPIIGHSLNIFGIVSLSAFISSLLPFNIGFIGVFILIMLPTVWYIYSYTEFRNKNIFQISIYTSLLYLLSTFILTSILILLLAIGGYVGLFDKGILQGIKDAYLPEVINSQIEGETETDEPLIEDTEDLIIRGSEDDKIKYLTGYSAFIKNLSEKYPDGFITINNEKVEISDVLINYGEQDKRLYLTGYSELINKLAPSLKDDFTPAEKLLYELENDTGEDVNAQYDLNKDGNIDDEELKKAIN